MRLGPYELVRQIGAGGMGEVWVAQTRGPGRTGMVAIKRLPRRFAGDPNYRRILLEEARLSALLRHPNIVHTIEAGEADGEVFIVMELIEGLDLARVTKLLARQGERLPIKVSAYVIAEVLRGLAYAHELAHEGQRISLVHRDVSPHNVMLSRSGAIKLADFGVARLSSEDTSGTHVKGKARYMPPEQLRGDSRSPTVDLFAVGAVLQELLDGSTFRGDAVDDARLLGMAIDGELPPPRHPNETPTELERLRVALLEPDPARRVQSAKQALALLLRWPEYGPCPDEVAALVERLREHEAELSTGVTQTGLANEATFLHTNDFELDASQMAELARAVEAPDRILVAVPAEPTAAAGPTDPPPRDPSLALDLADASFIRPIPTDAHAALPPRRSPWPLVIGLVLVIGGGLVGAHALGWLPTGADAPQEPASTLRHARLAGRGSMLDLGFRDRGMHHVLVDDIHFDYRPDPSVDPLAALARDEVEFALTSLDAFVRAGSPGTVVAVIGAPLVSEGLFLDLREEVSMPTVLVHSPGSAELATTLADVFGLERSELADDAAVLARLDRDSTQTVAGIVREPWLGKARSSGRTVVLTALDVPRADVEVLVVSDRTLAEDRGLVEAVVTTYYGLPMDADKLIERAVSAYRLGRSHAADVLASVCLFDAAGAVAWLASESSSVRVEPAFMLAAVERGTSSRNLPACLASAPSRSHARTLGSVAVPDVALFEPGSAVLLEQAAATLDELATKLRAFNPATMKLEVVGVGDSPGAKGRKLGSARADAVVQALNAAGVTLPMSASGRPHEHAPTSRIELRLTRAR